MRMLQLLRNTGIWAPIAVLIFHQFVSIKDWNTQIDWINHYCGGLSFTYFAWKSLPFFSRGIGNPTCIGRLMIAFLSGCTAALLWEVVEFSSDLLLNTSIQKSIHETMMDLVNGLLGTTTTVLIMGFRGYRTLKRDCVNCLKR